MLKIAWLEGSTVKPYRADTESCGPDRDLVAGARFFNSVSLSVLLNCSILHMKRPRIPSKVEL